MYIPIYIPMYISMYISMYIPMYISMYKSEGKFYIPSVRWRGRVARSVPCRLYLSSVSSPHTKATKMALALSWPRVINNYANGHPPTAPRLPILPQTDPIKE